jgi:hypothetical protein
MPNRLPTETSLAMAGFGERLRHLRQAYEERDGPRGHTRAQWAKRLRVSPAMYGRWESGKFLPRFEDLPAFPRRPELFGRWDFVCTLTTVACARFAGGEPSYRI